MNKKRNDTYDLLISSMGFHTPEITMEMIDSKQEEIIKLKKKLGIPHIEETYDLILFDDSIHDQIEAALMIYLINGCNSLDKMYEVHNQGKAIILSGSFPEFEKNAGETY